MKKILTVSLLILSLLLCLCACDGGEQTPTTSPTVATDAPTDAPTDPTDAPTDPTEEPTEPTEAPDPTYTVTIVDEAGNPVAGATMQICLEDKCIPNFTLSDENGKIYFFVDETEGYKVSFMNIPAGYELAGEETDFYFAAGENTITVTLKAVA